MALGSRLELLVVLSRCGSLILAGTAAAAIPGVASLPFRAKQFMWHTLSFGGILWGAALLLFQFFWLCFDDFEPGSVALLVLIAVDWGVACLNAGSACAALAANH
ncbi:uncharacterized protein [Triticum aestivum]|uniref:uncharacterized protein n=1 Tax=Triticum aestivum TaxID=4565 RepID=UPI001D02E40E|nr:uncharacterized protein LOC123040750 [Triticum aestivum]